MKGTNTGFVKKTKSKIFHCNAEALIQSSASGLYIRPTWGTWGLVLINSTGTRNGFAAASFWWQSSRAHVPQYPTDSDPGKLKSGRKSLRKLGHIKDWQSEKEKDTSSIAREPKPQSCQITIGWKLILHMTHEQPAFTNRVQIIRRVLAINVRGLAVSNKGKLKTLNVKS